MSRRAFRGGAYSFIDGDLLRSMKSWKLLPVATSPCGGLRICATIPAAAENNNSKESKEMNCKPIPNFPNYEISDCGRVFSLNYGRTRQRKELRPRRITGNYLQVTLCNNGKHYYKQVHRLVLEAFDKPCPAGMEACHNDGNRQNNHLGNLRWDTRVSNMADKKLHGTSHEGSRNGQAKLTEADVLSIRARYVPRVVTLRMLADEYGVTHTQICHIVKHKEWSHI